MYQASDITQRILNIDKQIAKVYDLGIFYKLFCDKPYTLLKVTALLTAKDDGSQALGIIENGKVIPKAPYLRNPSKNKNIDDNYVKDWIQLANYQLLRSGASFGLDIENLNYVLEKNTLLNTIECNSPTTQQKAVKDFITQKASVNSVSNPYYNSVILLFRWGSNPSVPAGQSCSGVDSQYILSNRYDELPITLDGELVGLTNNQITHEFGHFMGLDHPFINIANDMAGIADLGGRNPQGLPLLEENLPHMPGVAKADLINAKQSAIALIKDWGYNYDQDVFGHPDPPNIPDDYGIKDTPVDFGVGFPLIFGYKACSGS